METMTGSKNGSRRPGVVVVEDSRSDALLILEALKQDTRDLNVLLLTDGEKASEHFDDSEEVRFAPWGGPDLILMDLNLPKKGGAELIGEIKAIPALRGVPLVVFSGSDPSEVWRCYELGANLVVLKPHEAAPFINIVRAIKDYCLDMVGSGVAGRLDGGFQTLLKQMQENPPC